MSEPLSDSGNALIVMGGNRPPPDAFKDSAEFKAVFEKIDGLYMEAKNWADGSPIDSAAVHDEVTKLYNALKEAGAEAEALREALVKPLNDAKEVVQAAFRPLTGDTIKVGKGKVVLAREALAALLAPWRAEVQRKADEAARALAAEAQKKIDDAAAAIRETAGNLEAREGAEAQLREATGEAKVAKRATVAANTGTGLRRSYVARIDNLGAALAHYYNKGDTPHRAAFAALVQQIAGAEVRAGKRDPEGGHAIPGIIIELERKAT